MSQFPLAPRNVMKQTQYQSSVLNSQSYMRGEPDAGLNNVGDIGYSESKLSFQGATSVGLGLDLPTGREFILSMCSTLSATNVASMPPPGREHQQHIPPHQEIPAPTAVRPVMEYYGIHRLIEFSVHYWS
ncbi:hypothetical protein C8R44DRAFT_754153 [Mycena epipterygia]|nr:hypothetical protein C8R44DRAFT_754153 [Mycena epipterygia]